jgi:hypothetical protein
MSIATDVRAYADLALEQGKAALNQAGSAAGLANKRLTADAGKPVLVALGAADLIAETLGKQTEALGKRAENLGKRVESLPELPAAAAGNLAKAQEGGKALLDRAQDDAMARMSELRERLDAGLETLRSLPSLPEIAAGTTIGYLDNARRTYDKLTARGEARLADLRKDPRVGRLLGDLDQATAALNARIAPVVRSVRTEVAEELDSAAENLDSAAEAVRDADLGEPTAARPRRARTTAATSGSNHTAKPRARKAPAAKSGTARKSTAAKTSTPTSTTAKTTTRKTAASKA